MSLPSSPTAKQLADVTFEAGVNPDGTVAATSFANWQGQSPPTYSATSGYAHKWTNNAAGASVGAYGTAGTPGGTVTYSFGANVTADQQSAFEDALTLWSDEANLTFVQARPGKTADLELDVTNGGGTYNVQAPQFSSVAGSTQLPNQLTPTKGGAQDTISFDNSGDYGTLGSFSDAGGYGESAIVHEMGHMLGLGHSGPYNDGNGIDPTKAQYNAYDSRQWSIMSYVEPSAAAKYRASYPVKGTNWTSTTGNTTYQVAPETPMMDDILAAQRLYGASTSGALSGGQTFGFNCNITDGSRSFFDFSINTNPVVTLYDSGTDNTLDLSGFSTACKVDLNPGTFSSAGGTGTRLTNNIGIAYGTQIDTAIGGAGSDRFIVNADSDTIVGGAGSNRVVFAGARSGYVIAQTARNAATVTNKATGAVDTVSQVQTLKFANTSVSLAHAPAAAPAVRLASADAPVTPLCFVGGTRIRVLRAGRPADVAVEDLAVGDLALTAAGLPKRIRWLGHRRIDCRRHPRGAEIAPVRIAAHAFGPAVPSRDLWLSPGHPVLVGADADGEGGHLVPVMCLVNGTTVRRAAAESVTYWHVELDAHDILLAENLPAESYIDGGDRGFFTSGTNGRSGEDRLADPDFVAPGLAARCRPVAVHGPVVETARRRLDALFAMRLASACHWPLDRAEARA